jgi:hypothetical protein
VPLAGKAVMFSLPDECFGTIQTVEPLFMAGSSAVSFGMD